jgi:predicted DCC family thiol-disulfide oxidoreductase YuxK
MMQAMTTQDLPRGRRAPRFLVLLFDESCPLCRKLKAILATRRPLVPIHLVAVGSDRAVQLFPNLDLTRARDVLTVVDDSGTFYEGDAAWIVCLWALPGMRTAANHVSSGWRRRLLGSGLDGVNRVRKIGRDEHRPIAPYSVPDASDRERTSPEDCDGNCPVGLPPWLASEPEVETQNPFNDRSNVTKDGRQIQ